MKGLCDQVRGAIEQCEGLEGLRAHLDVCPGCQQHAKLVGLLDALDPGPAEPEVVREIMAALPVASWQRRLVGRWMPAAAGLILALLGVLFLGGVPAGGTMATLPGGVATWAATTGMDVVTAARESSDAVRVLFAAGGIWLGVWMLLAALGGSWSVLALARRSVGRR